MYNGNNSTDCSSDSYNELNCDYSYTKYIIIKTTIAIKIKLNKLVELVVKGYNNNNSINCNIENYNINIIL